MPQSFPVLDVQGQYLLQAAAGSVLGRMVRFPSLVLHVRLCCSWYTPCMSLLFPRSGTCSSAKLTVCVNMVIDLMLT